MAEFIVQFDVTYIEGNLAGLRIPGETIRCNTREQAERYLAIYADRADRGDFVRNAVTGKRYRVTNTAIFIRE